LKESSLSLFDPADVKSAAADDAAFRLSIRFLTGKIRFEVGESNYLLEIRDGEFVDFGHDESGQVSDITVTGSTEAWTKLIAQEVTPPGCQNPLFNDGRSGVQVEGDVVRAVGPHARAINEFYRILRRVTCGKQVEPVLPEVERDFDAAVGRYMYLRIQGVQYRIYYEEAGQGSIPLLLQHTAGADSRQSRHILEDTDFQKHFRIFAYDLPFHGRSLPPTSRRWWEDEYILTKNFLFDFIIGFSEKLGLDRPVFMGPAMGGMLALDLAYYFPEKFRAVVGLNAGPPAEFPESVLEKMASFSDPRVSSHWLSTMMVANMAGTSPEIYRRELGWVYGQSAPGVPEGALFYYTRDHDLTIEQAATIDTNKIPVYLFTGEDDSMGTDFGTPRLAKAMANTPFKMLHRLGHFGGAENPEAFKADIWPALEEIIARHP
jgi:pimeloyl-ACP methyl ester carboxylesterase